MDLQFSEDTKCNDKEKCCNQLNIFPIGTVAFTVSQICDKTSINKESNDLEYPKNYESASSTTLKNTNSIINNATDVTERPLTPVNSAINVTETPVIPINNAINLSESIARSISYIKKPLNDKVFSTLKPKPRKCTRLVKKKNTYFKNKHPENNINKKLETYYDKAKIKCANAGKIQRKIYSDSILNAVSLTRILKKVLAKENLLDDIDEIYLNGNHNEDNISYMSESSHTLTRERSISSDNTDFNNTITPPSVIDISNSMLIKDINSVDTNIITKLISSNISIEIDKNEHPYKTDIIAVAVAHIENASILNYKKEPSVTYDRKNIIVKNSLTSEESYLSQTVTESSTSCFETLHKLEKVHRLVTVGFKDSDVSTETLTESQNVYNITSESDKFVIAKTSSYFRNDHVDSNTTLTPMLGLRNETDVQQPKLSKPKLLKSLLLDTIINVGMFPKMTASIHDNRYNSELKEVIITEELRDALPLNRLDNNISNENKYSKNIFQKSFNAEDDSNCQKNLILPNEETIKELLFNKDPAQKRSCSEEFRTYTPFSELWDKLTVFLDIAMKKMEEIITEKITQEMKKTLDRLDMYINTTRGNPKVSKSDTDFKKEYHEVNIISTMESGESKSLQCDSIQNKILDELVKKNNLPMLKILKHPPFKTLGIKDKFKIGEEFIEVMKPTVAPCVSNEKRIGDSIVASSSKVIEIKHSKLQYLPLFMITIVRFVKENLLVITSVPLFCVALFLIYTFLVVLAKF